MSKGGGAAYLKKINRSKIVEVILEHGMISRADISKVTGINKATISAQVAELLEEELVCEKEIEYNQVGRRPIMVSINKESGYVLGIDLDYGTILYSLADLQGNLIHSYTEITETDQYEEIVNLLQLQIQEFQDKCAGSRYGLISVMIGVHGTVKKDEQIYYIPKYKWKNKNLKDDLQQKLGLEIHIENNANLAAYAESVFKYPESSHLISLILTSGIGAGIIFDQKIQRGFHGYAGEMGHMIISLNGKECRCGNSGCWELYCSERYLIQDLSIQLNQPDLTREEIIRLMKQKNPMILEKMEAFLTYLSLGLNNITNLYNPETIVINSQLLSNFPDAIEKVKGYFYSSVSEFGEIALSELGEKACVMGACALSLKRFFDVPKLILKKQDKEEVSVD